MIEQPSDSNTNATAALGHGRGGVDEPTLDWTAETSVIQTGRKPSRMLWLGTEKEGGAPFACTKRLHIVRRVLGRFDNECAYAFSRRTSSLAIVSVMIKPQPIASPTITGVRV
jgi:hypothetical protein